MYKGGSVTTEDFASTFQTYQAAVDAMDSPQRKAMAEILRHSKRPGETSEELVQKRLKKILGLEE